MSEQPFILHGQGNPYDHRRLLFSVIYYRFSNPMDKCADRQYHAALYAEAMVQPARLTSYPFIIVHKPLYLRDISGHI
jgi:hypothetical protein